VKFYNIQTLGANRVLHDILNTLGMEFISGLTRGYDFSAIYHKTSFFFSTHKTDT